MYHFQFEGFDVKSVKNKKYRKDYLIGFFFVEIIEIFVSKIKFREKNNKFFKKQINIVKYDASEEAEPLVNVLDTDVVDEFGKKVRESGRSRLHSRLFESIRMPARDGCVISLDFMYA